MMNLNSFSYYYPFLYIVETIMTLCVKSINTTANIYRNNHDESEFIFLLLPLIYYPIVVETIMTLCVKSINTTANIYRNNHDESEFIFLLLPLSLYCRDHYDLMCEIN